MDYILLVFGFLLLVKGADFFIDGSVVISDFFHIPRFIVGLTIVALGTSAPEAAVSITAALNGQNGIAVGNVLGSNMFNILVALGACAIVSPCPVPKSIIKNDIPFSMLATLCMLFLAADSILGGASENIISRGDGLVLAIVFIIFLKNTIASARPDKLEEDEGSSLNEKKPLGDDKRTSKGELVRSVLVAILGMGAIVIGGEFVVDSASSIAMKFGMSETLTGLTIVALGTSLPELATSVSAAIKKENDIAIGNVVGSNIFNILFVLSLSSSIHPIKVELISIYDIVILLSVSLLVIILALKDRSIKRWHGVLMLIIYVGYLAYIVMR